MKASEQHFSIYHGESAALIKEHLIMSGIASL